MKLQFTGKRFPAFEGTTGFGDTVLMKAGDTASFSPSRARQLLTTSDFVEAKEHAPSKNKMASKGASFKSK